MKELWSINTSNFIGYSEKHPSGYELVSLVPFREYSSYRDAYDECRNLATKLQKTCYLGNASPYQVSVYPIVNSRTERNMTMTKKEGLTEVGVECHSVLSAIDNHERGVYPDKVVKIYLKDLIRSATKCLAEFNK